MAAPEGLHVVGRGQGEGRQTLLDTVAGDLKYILEALTPGPIMGCPS